MLVGQCIACRTHGLALSLFVEYVQNALIQGFKWFFLLLLVLSCFGSLRLIRSGFLYIFGSLYLLCPDYFRLIRTSSLCLFRTVSHRLLRVDFIQLWLHGLFLIANIYGLC